MLIFSKDSKNNTLSKNRFNIDCTKYNILAITSFLLIFLVLGLFIPTNVISASPIEFVINGTLPYPIILYSIIIFAGFFLWELLYCKMSKGFFKVLLSALAFSISAYLLLNHFVFINDFGSLSENLIYSNGFRHFVKMDGLD